MKRRGEKGDPMPKLAMFITTASLLMPCYGYCGDMTVRGLGNDLCRDWIIHGKTGQTVADKQSIEMYASWIAGYVTAEVGHPAMDNKIPDDSDINTNDVVNYAYRYCKEKPNDRIVGAAIAASMVIILLPKDVRLKALRK
jgi:hypothetical protein